MADFEVLLRLAADAAMSDEEVAGARDARDYQEADTTLLEAKRASHHVPKLTDDEVRALASDEARVAILNFEVSSEAYYRKAYERPILPGVASGITVGIGYDLGYNDPETVRRDFADVIPGADIERLARCCKLRGEAARPRLAEVADLRVPLEAAKEVYRRATIPRFGRMVLSTFPNTVALEGHCFGALLSLVYNRGNDLAGDRRREMKAIRDLMDARQWDGIPEQFRLMKRIWKGDPKARGLLARREAEAKLFERGLELLGPMIATASLENLETAKSGKPSDPSPEALEGDGFYYRELDDTAEALERLDPDWNKVVWPDEARAPDYAHIPDRTLAGTAFAFSSRDLELLIEANAFQPSREHGRIVFALRGAELVSDLQNPQPMSPQENRATLTLREVKPDHNTFRCVVGIYDIDRGRLSGYTASTVPNPKAVASYVAGGTPSNMMLTGCYEFEVGWHQASQPQKKIPGCLIENGRRKAVLRTRADHTYEVTDIVHDTMPGDNVHPGKSEGPFPFSSWGCLVLKGSVTPVRDGDRTNVTHTGEWALFRKALGLPDRGTGGHGRKISVALLTGLDAAIATNASSRQQSPSSEPFGMQLQRLRQGSHGPRVAALRRTLGLPNGDGFTADVASKLADLQRSKLGGAYGLYAPWMDEKLGLDVFKLEPQIAMLERRRAGTSDHQGERDRLAFELGAEFESSRGHRAVSDDAHHEGLLATVGEFGKKALMSTGSVLMREAELMLKSQLCERDVAGSIMNRDDIRKRVDDAARTSTNALKHVLVTVLKQATFSFAPYDLLERVVGYLLDEVLMPSTGAAGDAVIGRIDGGIAWLCARWGERLGTAEADGTFQTPTMPAQEVPATAGALMSSGTTNGPPPSSPVTGEASRLLALLHATASGESPDAAGVRNYIHQLRDHLQNSNTTLSPKENKRFLDILCDTRFLGQITGAAGRDPYVLLADIEDALAKSPVDKSVVEGRVRSLCDVLADARVKLQPERVEKTIKALRRGRLPDLIALLADRVLTREPDAALLGRIGPHYALSLIDGQKIVAGIEVLHAVLERGQLTAEVNAEVLGGLGRAHKQIYVNHVKSVSDALALEPTHGQQLTRAIDYYSRLYDPGKPNENAWHGINLVALLKRAEADRLRLGTRHDAHALAQGMIGAIEPRNSNTDDHYALATLGEAYLALDEIEKAARFYAAFANHPATDAFALNSAVRQLEEVWRLQASKDGAGTLLVGLKAALAQKEGGRITLSSAERQAIAAATTVEHQEQFESRTQGGKFVPLEYLKRVVFTGMAVAAVKQRSDLGGKHTTGAGETIGTGFLIDGATLGLPSGSSYLLTNAHVLWDPDKGQGLENSALPPAQAAIVFEGADGHGGVFSCSKIHWQSPSGLHDAALVELDRVVEGIKPLVFASGEMKLDIDDGGGKKGTRLAVVGHPEGGALSVGLTGSLEDISARLVDKGPKGNSQDPTYLHYSAPTEPGNSGSPVLEADHWHVVGLHHAGFNETNGRPRLGGKAGSHLANEGICIQCIRSAVKESLNPPKKPRRGFFG